MLKARILLIVGIWVALLPYLGFPRSIKEVLFSASGLFIIYVSFVIYKENKIKKKREVASTDSFSENRDFVENKGFEI